MFKVIRFTSENTTLASQALDIRKKVFVEEQGVHPTLENDHEDEAMHFLLFLLEKPIATARWRETVKGIKLERFAVLPEFRNRGIGEIILKAVLEDVAPLEKPIYLHAQTKAVSFYERNGFEKVGEQFTEAGLEHYLMTYSR